ncbi:hypothetical protein LTR66_000246 [Elasticomyces elasticus]|nr:hypothetical protein LTR28_003667 [Elasticomyces elasticus]KAK5000967.1 hypothetical protein LTR66_000246 [Elasticomyces elasticus]
MAPAPSDAESLQSLRDEWKEMFQKQLPQAATSHAPAQAKWPVHVDHCFARIILDKTCGVDTPWMDKIKSPAYMNMSEEQLEASINLGKQILEGEVDLVELDNESLALRGKGEGMSGKASGRVLGKGQGTKRKREETTRQRNGEPESKSSKKEMHAGNVNVVENTPGPEGQRNSDTTTPKSPTATPESETAKPKERQNPSQGRTDLAPYINKIALSTKTPFQKRVLTALCQVPPGHYTTYAALSTHLKSSARAVGNALRNNPFAPHVPCHRVLASDASIGGFGGDWGRKGQPGKNDGKKRRLLRDEGVRFDGKGRAVGRVWDKFVT